MSILRFLATLADLAIDLFLKCYAIFLIFQHNYFYAAIVFGAWGVYSLSMTVGHLIAERTKTNE